MRAKTIAAWLLCLPALLVPAAAASAAPQAAWKLTLSSQPTDFAPGAKASATSDIPEYLAIATNVGAAATSGPVTMTLTLPASGIAPAAAAPPRVFDNDQNKASCSIVSLTVTCVESHPVPSGSWVAMSVPVDIAMLADGSTVTAQASVLGGGAAAAAGAATTTTIGAADAPFEILPGAAGLSASLNGPEGAPVTAAGSHPYQLTVDLGTSTRAFGSGGGLGGAGGALRDLSTSLPRGLLVDPSATPVLCTEVQLESSSCPAASAVGVASTLTTPTNTPLPVITAIYNMVPPPGTAAELAYDAIGGGLYIHIKGGLRAGDYTLDATVNDIAARALNPLLAAQIQLWGDPSGVAHDKIRGKCANGGEGNVCPVPHQASPFLTLPSACSATNTVEAEADSWGSPGSFDHATAGLTGLEGTAIAVDGCEQLEFEPTIEAKPTTDLADSPSGLDFALHQPQSFDLGTLAGAALKDATVTLPAGVAVNPSQADGLGACSIAQIGLATAVGQAPVRFDGRPASCPDSAKLGTVEVSSPLLAQHDEQNKVVREPEGGVVPEPLHGSVYLAQPFANPFGSLVAIYLSIDDPKTGIVAKLAGRASLDPATGQITTRFEENPQLPLEDVELHLFGGARGALITPPTCGVHTTTTDLTPWSTPAGADAHPEGSFQTTAAPGGGPCPSAAGAASSVAAFSAGTLSPQAGAYSPFLLKLNREDGSQRIAAIDTTLAPGLTGKLAGIPYCSESQIAQAQARSHPNEGALEKASPSCPLASEVGGVVVGAGAGPNPFHVQGHAYLAGPYKGAPLSLVIITPAVAGPFDLGAVVVRTALNVDPATAQIHAVSDPLPTNLDGIPLDVRSIALRMDRPDFTLNPTSCNPLSITGNATSTLGQLTPLSSRFQVGDCQSLKFAPKLALSLRGGTRRSENPALKAVLTYPKGNYANIARAQVTLPHSEFLEQSHIGTVCTQPQLKARSCPKASIYGRATAITPLLDKPLTGPVYLGVGFGHKLPDLVVDLDGQIRVLLNGKVDTGKGGGIRNTFLTVPDAPVSKFTLELFGGKKGLIVNSENICSPHAQTKAIADFTAQNGKIYNTRPTIRNSCKGKAKKRQGKGDRRRTR
jgi:hypothetical protein